MPVPTPGMELQPVARGQWRTFCESFGRAHRGWLVTLRRLSTRQLEFDREQAVTEAEVMCSGVPLRRIVEVTSPGGRDGLLIAVAADGIEQWLAIDDVVALYDERTEGGDYGLRTDCSDGTTALLEFRVDALPEAVDGLAASEL